MTSTEYAINLESGRLIKKLTAKYKKLKKLGKVKEFNTSCSRSHNIHGCW